MNTQAATGGRCICCDLPPSSCGKAIEAKQRREAAETRAARLATPGWHGALYAGFCLRCGDRFGVGEPIRQYAQGWACCE